MEESWLPVRSHLPEGLMAMQRMASRAGRMRSPPVGAGSRRWIAELMAIASVRAPRTPLEIDDGAVEFHGVADRFALFVPERNFRAGADDELGAAISCCTPCRVFGPERAGVVLDELPSRIGIPQAPHAVAAGGRDGGAVGTPGEGVAAVGVGGFEAMQGAFRRDVQNVDLAGNRSGGEALAIGRPGDLRDEIVELRVPAKINGAAGGHFRQELMRNRN